MPNHRPTSETRVGAIVFLGLLLFAFAVFLIGGERGILRPQYTLFVTFPNIYGLDVGASIRLGGLDVGRVKNIYFAEDLAKKYVLVELQIDKRMQNRVREDSVASIQTLGLLGDKYIAVSVGSKEFKTLKEGDFLISEAPGDISEFLDKGGEVLENIVEITRSLSRMLEKRGLDSFLGDMSKLVHSASTMFEQIRTGPGTVHDLIYRVKGSNVDTVMNNLATGSQNFSAVLKKINEGTGTLGALVNDRTAYEDLKALLGGARRSKLFQYMIRYSVEKSEETEPKEIPKEKQR